MPEYFKNLNRIEFIVTSDCTGRCIHCSQGEHPHTGTYIDKTAACKVISELAEKYKIESVMTFGGEPLLYPECVCAIHSIASEFKIPKRQLITNGYFSNDKEKILSVAKKLKKCKVNDILLSVDAFHEEYIPLEPVLFFAGELLKLDLPLRLNPAWLVSREDANLYNLKTVEIIEKFKTIGASESEGNIVFPEGNAARNLAEYFDTDKIYSNPYEEKPDDIRTISVEADNTVFGKSVLKHSIIDIMREYEI